MVCVFSPTLRGRAWQSPWCPVFHRQVAVLLRRKLLRQRAQRLVIGVQGRQEQAGAPWRVQGGA